jgi:hypothetical protein
LLVNRIKSPLTWGLAFVMAPSTKIYLKNASSAQGLCCKSIQNAHILACLLRFRMVLRRVLLNTLMFLKAISKPFMRWFAAFVKR